MQNSLVTSCLAEGLATLNDSEYPPLKTFKKKLGHHCTDAGGLFIYSLNKHVFIYWPNTYCPPIQYLPVIKSHYVFNQVVRTWKKCMALGDVFKNLLWLCFIILAHANCWCKIPLCPTNNSVELKLNPTLVTWLAITSFPVDNLKQNNSCFLILRTAHLKGLQFVWVHVQTLEPWFLYSVS